jgi:hypothetical protein
VPLAEIKKGGKYAQELNRKKNIIEGRHHENNQQRRKNK